MPAKRLSKDKLLANMEKGRRDFAAFLATIPPEKLTGPTDAADWTGADHIMHLAVWLHGVNVLLDKGNRYEAMGLDLDLFKSGDFDAMNAVIQQAHKDASLEDARAALEKAQARIVEQVMAMSEDDLYQPYKVYAPGTSDSTRPVINTIIADTYEHYAEHAAWIRVIAEQG